MKKILYLGLDPQRFSHQGELCHYPVIGIKPYPSSLPTIQYMLDLFEHFQVIIFTSQTTIKVLCALLEERQISTSVLLEKKNLAIGKATSTALVQLGVQAAGVAQKESAEGMIELLKTFNLDTLSVLYPKSAFARPLIANFLHDSHIHHLSCSIYEPQLQIAFPIPCLSLFDELVFTSPSVVDAFIKIFGPIPWEKQITSIGPVTAKYLDSLSQKVPF